MKPTLCWLGLLVPTTASADESGGGLRLDLEAQTVVHVGRGDPSITNLTLLTGHFDLSYGGAHVRYAAAVDLSVGAALGDEGIAFDATLLPFGVGVQLRQPEHTAFVGVTTGIAASGGPPALASTAAIPIQLVATVRLAEKWNVLSRARASWMINRSSRDAGAPTSSHVDELSGMLALQRSQFWNYLEGYYAGVAYRELEGGRFVGLVFGNSGGEEVTSTQR